MAGALSCKGSAVHVPIAEADVVGAGDVLAVLMLIAAAAVVLALWRNRDRRREKQAVLELVVTIDDRRGRRISGRTMLPPEDAPEPGARPAAVGSDVIAGAAYGLDYVDYSGNRSSRVITVYKVRPWANHIYIDAYCHARGDERTFRDDRVLALYDHRTGEVIEPVRGYLENFITLADRFPMHDSVMKRVRPGLTALIWLAHADGAMSEEEIDVLFDYVDEHLEEGPRPRPDWMTFYSEDALREWIKAQHPRPEDVAAIVTAWPKRGKDLKLFRDYALDLIEVDGVTTDEERRRMEALVGTLTPAPPAKRGRPRKVTPS